MNELAKHLDTLVWGIGFLALVFLFVRVAMEAIKSSFSNKKGDDNGKSDSK